MNKKKDKKLEKAIEDYIKSEERFCPYCLKKDLYYGPEFPCNNREVQKILHCTWCRAVWDEYIVGGNLDRIDIRIKGTKGEFK